MSTFNLFEQLQVYNQLILRKVIGAKIRLNIHINRYLNITLP